MNFLKTCSILEAMNGAKITKDSLLAVTELINNKVEKTFSKGMKEVKPVTSCSIDKGTLDAAAVDLICEDSRLSLRVQGFQYLVIDRRLIDYEVPIIDEQFLVYLLDIAASMYDMDASWPSGQGDRKLWWSITGSDGFKEGRKVLESRL